jgi:hypothetical protein
LDKNGDYAGGQSISNIQLQMGDPIARYATGNTNSNGNTHPWVYTYSGIYDFGSNQLVGNNFGASLNGGGVGNLITSLGRYNFGFGCDTLIGNSGVGSKYGDTFVVTDPSYYITTGNDRTAYGYYGGVTTTLAGGGSYYTYFGNPLPNGTNALSIDTTVNPHGFATDLNYTHIKVNGSTQASDILQLNPLGTGQYYFIGSAPTDTLNGATTGGFNQGNLQGGLTGKNAVLSNDKAITDFGIYRYDINASFQAPKLVAEISGISLADFATLSGSAQNGSLSIATITVQTSDSNNKISTITDTLDAGVLANGTTLSAPSTYYTYLSNASLPAGSKTFKVQDTTQLHIGDVIDQNTYGFASGTTVTGYDSLGDVTISSGTTSNLYTGSSIQFDHIIGTSTNHLGGATEFYTYDNGGSQYQQAQNLLGTGAFLQLNHLNGTVHF